MTRLTLEGVFPAMLTPFTKKGTEVDYERAVALANRLADQGVHGVFVAGTTGEGLLMTLEERKRLLEEVIAAVSGRIHVLAHAGTLDTASTIELTRHAMEAGATAAGVVAPGFYTYDDDALFAHFKAVARAVKGFPVLLYNLPSCAKNVIGPELVFRLAASVDNIVGIKDSGGLIQKLDRVLIDAPKTFTVINGVDEYSFQALCSGAKGSVSSTANVIPEVFLDIFNNVKQGRLERARKAQDVLSRAAQVFHYGAMVAYYKEGLRLRGFDAGSVRPPQRELSRQEKRTFAEGLEELGLI